MSAGSFGEPPAHAAVAEQNLRGADPPHSCKYDEKKKCTFRGTSSELEAHEETCAMKAQIIDLKKDLAASNSRVKELEAVGATSTGKKRAGSVSSTSDPKKSKVGENSNEDVQEGFAGASPGLRTRAHRWHPTPQCLSISLSNSSTSWCSKAKTLPFCCYGGSHRTLAAPSICLERFLGQSRPKADLKYQRGLKSTIILTKK